MNENAKTLYVLVLCHSTVRCAEIEEFLKKLTTFCSDVVEVLNLYSGDMQENMITLKKSFNVAADNKNLKSIYKARCKIIVSTPNQASQIYKKEGFKNT